MRKISLTGTLYRLIYCSRTAAGGSPTGPEQEAAERQVRLILAAARIRNRADNLTGALLFTGSGFAQALEGQRDAVERTFDRIGADPRHSDVTVLSFTPTERRHFPDWPLGFCGNPVFGAADPLAPILTDATYAGPRATTGTDVLRLLEKLVRHEDEWIAA